LIAAKGCLVWGWIGLAIFTHTGVDALRSWSYLIANVAHVPQSCGIIAGRNRHHTCHWPATLLCLLRPLFTAEVVWSKPASPLPHPSTMRMPAYPLVWCHCQKTNLGWLHPILYWKRPSEANSVLDQPMQSLNQFKIG
jgi:hypothetical protein